MFFRNDFRDDGEQSTSIQQAVWCSRQSKLLVKGLSKASWGPGVLGRAYLVQKAVVKLGVELKPEFVHPSAHLGVIFEGAFLVII